MAIAPNFEMALMKAVRGAEIAMETLNDPHAENEVQRADLLAQDDRRIFTVFAALKQGMSVEEIHEITKIDRFFLEKLKVYQKLPRRQSGHSLRHSASSAKRFLPEG